MAKDVEMVARINSPLNAIPSIEFNFILSKFQVDKILVCNTQCGTVQ